MKLNNIYIRYYYYFNIDIIFMHIFQFGFDIRNTMTCAVLVLEMVTIQILTP